MERSTARATGDAGLRAPTSRARGARRAPRPWRAVVVALAWVGCRDAPPAIETPPGESGAGAVSAEETAAPEIPLGERHLRTLVFLEAMPGTDTATIVAWDFGAQVRGDSIQRRLRGWLGRAGQWSAFVDDAWTTPPSRAPWRILPRGPVRLAVGLEDAVRAVRYEEGARRLTVRLDDLEADWSDPEGGAYRIHAGTARLGDAEKQGWVVDVSSARDPDAVGRDEWAFLIAEDGRRLTIGRPHRPGPFGAWAWEDRPGAGSPEPDAEEGPAWPAVAVSWGETGVFEEARRELPALWDVESSDGTLRGRLRAVSAQRRALGASGPISPVLALYEVAGEMSVRGERVAVRGFLRHAQR